VLSPYNIGHSPVFPYPRWDERVFQPVFYSTPAERVILALTALYILLLLMLLVLVLLNVRAPVIRAATPSFCVVSICGAACMLASNFFATYVVTAARCAAQVWLLTLGFTLLFTALFVKTFRIWRIFGQQKLTVIKMRNADLLMAVGAFVMVDVILNALSFFSDCIAIAFPLIHQPAHFDTDYEIQLKVMCK